MLEATTSASLKFHQSVDSIAALPHTHTHTNDSDGAEITTQKALIGRYALQDCGRGTPQTRAGSVVLVHATRIHGREGGDGKEGEMWELTDEGTVDLPGVLDVCAAGETTGDGDSVYAACAENAVVEIRAGGTGGKGCSLGLGREVTAREVECGSLKLAVDVKADGEQTHLVAASDSRGGVCLYRVRAGKGEMEEVERRQMHDLEAWSVCMRERGAGDGRQRLYSGGDDGSVCGWEMGAEGDMFRLRTGHCGVGVTAVATEEGREHELWTGGYDDMVRVWDVRAMKEAMCEVGVGGGVWRIKFHPRKNLVLVAAMYDGFKVVERSGDELRVVCDYQEHESLAYGACWLPGLDRAGTATALTGSFYDCSVRLWSVSTDG